MGGIQTGLVEIVNDINIIPLPNSANGDIPLAPYPLTMIITNIKDTKNIIYEVRYDIVIPDTKEVVATTTINTKYNSSGFLMSPRSIKKDSTSSIAAVSIKESGGKPRNGLTIQLIDPVKDKDPNIRSKIFDDKDEYIINTYYFGLNNSYPDTSIYIDFVRDRFFISEHSGNWMPGSIPKSNDEILKINTPEITIQSQTLVDGSDVGNTNFLIKDIFQYYDHKNMIIPNHKCQEISVEPDQIKITYFEKCAVKIVSVLKCEGKTAFDKGINIYKKYKLNIGTKQFGENLVLYAMSKYILSKILYGNFNVNYLLRKYNDKFIEDLSNSRFCVFVPFFTIGTLRDYYKYFLYDN